MHFALGILPCRERQCLNQWIMLTARSWFCEGRSLKKSLDNCSNGCWALHSKPTHQLPFSWSWKRKHIFYSSMAIAEMLTELKSLQQYLILRSLVGVFGAGMLTFSCPAFSPTWASIPDSWYMLVFICTPFLANTGMFTPMWVTNSTATDGFATSSACI